MEPGNRPLWDVIVSGGNTAGSAAAVAAGAGGVVLDPAKHRLFAPHDPQ